MSLEQAADDAAESPPVLSHDEMLELLDTLQKWASAKGFGSDLDRERDVIAFLQKVGQGTFEAAGYVCISFNKAADPGPPLPEHLADRVKYIYPEQTFHDVARASGEHKAVVEAYAMLTQMEVAPDHPPPLKVDIPGAEGPAVIITTAESGAAAGISLPAPRGSLMSTSQTSGSPRSSSDLSTPRSSIGQRVLGLFGRHSPSRTSNDIQPLPDAAVSPRASRGSASAVPEGRPSASSIDSKAAGPAGSSPRLSPAAWRQAHPDELALKVQSAGPLVDKRGMPGALRPAVAGIEARVAELVDPDRANLADAGAATALGRDIFDQLTPLPVIVQLDCLKPLVAGLGGLPIPHAARKEIFAGLVRSLNAVAPHLDPHDVGAVELHAHLSNVAHHGNELYENMEFVSPRQRNA
ncbi:MAG: hypothetical protein EOO28_21465 [Comamonadaceae bacterium]|nr:MAG: hypothetical protein EOO28_21465 [Comamonadaceae bacterium]